MNDNESAEFDGSQSAEAVALSARDNVGVRALVRGLPAQLAQSLEDDGRTGCAVDHSTVHRWAIKLLPVLERAFRRCKRPVGKRWRMDETSVKRAVPIWPAYMP
ncbi:hypothetical protein OKW37_005936 [Paraburkholderia sp. MM5482-R2]